MKMTKRSDQDESRYKCVHSHGARIHSTQALPFQVLNSNNAFSCANSKPNNASHPKSGQFDLLDLPSHIWTFNQNAIQMYKGP